MQNWSTEVPNPGLTAGGIYFHPLIIQNLQRIYIGIWHAAFPVTGDFNHEPTALNTGIHWFVDSGRGSPSHLTSDSVYSPGCASEA